MTNEEILANAPDENLTHYDGDYYWKFTNENGWCRYCNPIAKAVVSEPSRGMRSLSDIRRIATLEFANSVPDRAIADTCSENYELAKEVKSLENRAEASERERDELLTDLLTLAMATGRDETWRKGLELKEKFAIEQQIKGATAFAAMVVDTGQFGWSDSQWLTDFVEEYADQLRQQLNGGE